MTLTQSKQQQGIELSKHLASFAKDLQSEYAVDLMRIFIDKGHDKISTDQIKCKKTLFELLKGNKIVDKGNYTTEQPQVLTKGLQFLYKRSRKSNKLKELPLPLEVDMRIRQRQSLPLELREYMDCHSFAMFATNNLGLQGGTKISSLHEVQPGDVVTLKELNDKGKEKEVHSGVYLGEDILISAKRVLGIEEDETEYRYSMLTVQTLPEMKKERNANILYKYPRNTKGFMEVHGRLMNRE